MLRPSLFGKAMLLGSLPIRFRGCHRHPMLFSAKMLEDFRGSIFGQNNMGCLWQPLNVTWWLLHNIGSLKTGSLSILNVHGFCPAIKITKSNPRPADYSKHRIGMILRQLGLYYYARENVENLKTTSVLWYNDKDIL